MNLTEQINSDIKVAMKAREKDTLEALRAIKSALLLEATKDSSGDELDDTTGIKILQKLHKQRMEAAAIYKEQNREDLLAVEQKQADVISKYLPQPMSAEELAEGIKAIITKVNAEGMKDMGKVMGIASKEFAGKANGKDISDQVKALLS